MAAPRGDGAAPGWRNQDHHDPGSRSATRLGANRSDPSGISTPPRVPFGKVQVSLRRESGTHVPRSPRRPPICRRTYAISSPRLDLPITPQECARFCRPNPSLAPSPHRRSSTRLFYSSNPAFIISGEIRTPRLPTEPNPNVVVTRRLGSNYTPNPIFIIPIAHISSLIPNEAILARTEEGWP